MTLSLDLSLGCVHSDLSKVLFVKNFLLSRLLASSLSPACPSILLPQRRRKGRNALLVFSSMALPGILPGEVFVGTGLEFTSSRMLSWKVFDVD